MATEENPRTLPDVEGELDACVASVEEKLGECASCFLIAEGIAPSSVDSVYDKLQERFGFKPPTDIELVVILESGGGDIDAAYDLAHLLRKYGANGLKFIIPRWAKSAATLLACSGKEILMSPVAELGPLDPQITAMNPLSTLPSVLYPSLARRLRLYYIVLIDCNIRMLPNFAAQAAGSGHWMQVESRMYPNHAYAQEG